MIRGRLGGVRNRVRGRSRTSRVGRHEIGDALKDELYRRVVIRITNHVLIGWGGRTGLYQISPSVVESPRGHRGRRVESLGLVNFKTGSLCIWTGAPARVGEGHGRRVARVSREHVARRTSEPVIRERGCLAVRVGARNRPQPKSKGSSRAAGSLVRGRRCQRVGIAV